MNIRRGTSTPWGAVQTHNTLAEGVISVDTARHGGIWLSEERRKELPDEYEPYTGTTEWNEEDEDGGLVLQYLGLLSLIEEDMELQVTEWDISLGRGSRKDLWGERLDWYKHKDISEDGIFGGPIVEAYKRLSGDTRWDEMICSHHLSPRPGGFRLARLCDGARAFMKQFDAGDEVQPQTFTIQPYRVLERVTFHVTLDDGRVWTDRCNGRTAQGIINGVDQDLQFYLWLNPKTTKIEFEGRTLYKKE